jgi:hypothetical protein
MRKSIDAMGSSSYHSPAHCFDESPAGYSWVGCSPAEPTCASPAESIMPNRRSIEKRNDRNAPFHPTPLTKNCKGCPGTKCKGCLGTGHDVGVLGWTAALGLEICFRSGYLFSWLLKNKKPPFWWLHLHWFFRFWIGPITLRSRLLIRGLNADG